MDDGPICYSIKTKLLNIEIYKKDFIRYKIPKNNKTNALIGLLSKTMKLIKHIEFEETKGQFRYWFNFRDCGIDEKNAIKAGEILFKEMLVEIKRYIDLEE